MRGLQVTGSDHALYPPMGVALVDWGIEAQQGFDYAHLEAADPEWVVIGNAVRPDNLEAQAALDGDYVVRSFSDALYELAMADKHSVVVSRVPQANRIPRAVSAVLLWAVSAVSVRGLIP